VHFVQALGSAGGLASGDVWDDSDQEANVGVVQAAPSKGRGQQARMIREEQVDG
jgi:hypothetical protein